MEQMGREGVTSFCAPPTVWRMLIQADLTQLKNPPTKVVSAGEPLNAEVIDQVEKRLGRQTIRDGFGQTESTVQIANTPGQAGQDRRHGPAAARATTWSWWTPPPGRKPTTANSACAWTPGPWG